MAQHWGVEETDNAQLQAHLTDISSRVPGTITRVAVQDDQQVRKGDLLVALDDRDARAQLRRAEADLAEARSQAEALGSQARASLSGAGAAGSLAAADQESAAAELARTAADLRRIAFLFRQGGVSAQDYDRARASYQLARSQLTHSQALRQQAQASRQQVGVDRQKAAAAQARIQQAEAAVAAARLQLSYAAIVAPSDGRIGARSAEPGRQVQPGQPLMTLVDPGLWVEANFKETQLDALRPGQPAEVRIDAFPGRVFHGRVIGIAPASGSRFALLPPDNATGNFTKVVQRVAARLSLDEGSAGSRIEPDLARRLMPGLSASVRVRR